MARTIDARLLLAAASVALLLGCQHSPISTSLGSPTVDLKAEGDALAARGEYEVAAIKYEAAIRQAPDDVSLRFALGTALSYLGLRKETIDQFRFVVARGEPEMPEVQAARRWLIAAGKPPEGVTFAPSSGPEPAPTTASSASAPQPDPAGTVKVTGTTGLRPGTRQLRIVFFDPKRILTFDATGKPGESFEFPGVLPGTYKVTVEDPERGTQISEQEVTIAPGKDVALNLK
ncbi:MAG TPA: hypothetical protein VJO34_05750 [Methylomirabilota bacterium]|nr:hypothetical protein [Methylomirabilota bacterium]